ncbi:Amino acid transporter AVT1J [Linum grandiflorum]
MSMPPQLPQPAIEDPPISEAVDASMEIRIHHQNADTTVEPEPRSNEETSYLRTCLNTINALSGIGLLSIPYAMALGGWMTLPVLIVIAGMSLYTGILLKRCLDVDSSLRSYPDLGYRVWGNWGRTGVSVVLYVELFLVAVEFAVLEGDNIAKLSRWAGFHIGGLHLEHEKAFIFLSGFVFFLTTLIRDLKKMAYLSFFGIVAFILVGGCVVSAGVAGEGFNQRGHVVNLKGLPLGASMVTFCFCGHPLFPDLRSSMRDRAQFSKVLVMSFIVMTITYSLMGILGYTIYGDDVMSQITLNLPPSAVGTYLAVIATIISPLTKYAVVINPVAAFIEAKLHIGQSSWLRAAIVLSTVVVALLVPFFDDVMGLIGATTGTLLSFVFPCLLSLQIVQIKGWTKVTTIAVLIAGVLMGCVGFYASVRKIMKDIADS